MKRTTLKRTVFRTKRLSAPTRKAFSASAPAALPDIAPRRVAGVTQAPGEMREPQPKATVIASDALRRSATGERCTLEIAGVCEGRRDTVVLCHFPSDIKASKTSDAVSSGFGCHACHEWLDYRDPDGIGHPDREFYMRRSIARTQTCWIETGLIIISGEQAA